MYRIVLDAEAEFSYAAAAAQKRKHEQAPELKKTSADSLAQATSYIQQNTANVLFLSDSSGKCPHRPDGHPKAALLYAKAPALGGSPVLYA